MPSSINLSSYLVGLLNPLLETSSFIPAKSGWRLLSRLFYTRCAINIFLKLFNSVILKRFDYNKLLGDCF